MNKDNFMGNVKKAAGTVEAGFGDAVGDAGVELKGRARQVIGSVQDAFGNVQDSVDTVNTKIHERPVQSTLIALGLGFVIGRLMGL